MNEGPKKATAVGKCAICSKPIDPLFRPFCSKRCADVDLNRWLKGAYAIPAEEADTFDEDGESERS